MAGINTVTRAVSGLERGGGDVEWRASRDVITVVVHRRRVRDRVIGMNNDRRANVSGGGGGGGGGGGACARVST